MRMLNQDTDMPFKNVLLLLTPDEAAELRDDLETLLQKNDANQHTHINDMEYEHEITIAIYNDGEISSFDERTQKLISADE